jgi:two-component system, NtrC family, response regulator GlrR
MLHEICVIESCEMAPQLSVTRLLTPEMGFHCSLSNWAGFSAEKLRADDSQLILAVAAPEPGEALDFFRSLRTGPRLLPTVAVIPHDATEELMHTVLEATDDFVLWPVRTQELRQRLVRLLEWPDRALDVSRQRLIREIGLAQIVGTSPAFLRVLDYISLVGPSEAPVLLTGETGTGKEVCARSIHFLSRRQQGPFVPVDCGAVPENLAESELFGHTRGSFTGAHRDHRGLIALAEGGTLFLDEVDALSLTSQAKLLRFMQEGTYRPVGGERFVQADVRVIAATNRNVEHAVHDKQFRSDLYFRLNVLRVALPPLRERPGDIAMLARHFLERLTGKNNGAPKSLSPAALGKLELHRWPGNVRELFNVLTRAAVLAPGARVLPGHIVLSDDESSSPERCSTNGDFRDARSAAIAVFEQKYVEQMLRRHQGNITHAARAAGQDRRAFGRLAKKYNLHHKSGFQQAG